MHADRRVTETSYYTRLRRKNNSRRFWEKHRKLQRFVHFFWAIVVLVVIAGILYLAWPAIRPTGHRERNAEAQFQEDEPSKSNVSVAEESIPDFEGKDWINLNQGIPNFTEYDLTHITGEYYSDLDRLGRCGPAWAFLDRSMMPTEERGGIGSIRPSGWQTVKYPDIIEDSFLYNRCHLIAYGLCGQNDNEKNLITGTRYMNATSMLPFEIQVMQYLDSSENHVLYRVTPYFKGNELVARGVEMEAYSVEDQGKGVCYHVFVYNQHYELNLPFFERLPVFQKKKLAPLLESGINL